MLQILQVLTELLPIETTRHVIPAASRRPYYLHDMPPRIRTTGLVSTVFLTANTFMPHISHNRQRGQCGLYWPVLLHMGCGLSSNAFYQCSLRSTDTSCVANAPIHLYFEDLVNRQAVR